ncbi:hypothetical protein PILCRDRAFT_7807 [Piloderma croceum F 1598]|nr:hypothetical protein PILCRDRAFT_7807 [Piloderma croceum F 1598]
MTTHNLPIKSYASVASPATSQIRHPVRYVFKDIGIGTTTVNQRPPVIIMQQVTPSIEKAQNLFSTNDPILSPLNTSADLDQYTVESVNPNNSTVIVKHGCMVQERYSKLKENEKLTNLHLKRLEEKIEEQERQAAKSEADMYRWELLTRGIQGLNQFLWTTVLEQRQRDKLNAIGIHDMDQL